MAHRIPYCATASVAYPNDLLNKIAKAKEIKGPKVLHVQAPCPNGCGHGSEKKVEIGKLAVQTGLWYLAEYENGKVTLNYKPKEFKPVKSTLLNRYVFVISLKNISWLLNNIAIMSVKFSKTS